MKDVCDHVAGGNRFAVLVLSGEDWRAALATVQGGDFGGDPRMMFGDTGARQITAFAAEGALERRVSHPVGAMSGRDFARHRILDLVVHGWDIARAIGGDERMDDELAEIAYETLSAAGPPAGDGGAFGVGPSGLMGTNAPVQMRLLDLSGRRP